MGSSWAPQEHCLRGKWLIWDLYAAATENSQHCHCGKNLEEHRVEWSKAGWLSPANKHASFKGRLNQRLHTTIPPRTGVAQSFRSSGFWGSHQQDPGQFAIKEAGSRERSICRPGTRGLQEQELHIYAAWMPTKVTKGSHITILPLLAQTNPSSYHSNQRIKWYLFPHKGISWNVCIMENTHAHAPPYKLLIFSLLIVRFLAHMRLTFTPQKINFKARGKKRTCGICFFLKNKKTKKQDEIHSLSERIKTENFR